MMYLFWATLLSFIAVGTTAPLSPCVSRKAVHIVIARGTMEPQGYSLMGPVANAIVKKLPGSDIEYVVYPASFDLPSSPNAGVQNMTAQVTAYHQRCPSSNIVFMGYSQGAQVVGDVVGGGGSLTPNGSRTNSTPPISDAIMSKVVAMIQFGDPGRVRNTATDVDTNSCTVESSTARTGAALSKFTSYNSILEEWCDSNDPVCCSTGAIILAHLGYFTPDTSTTAANFVASKTRG